MTDKPFRSIAARNNEDAEWYTPGYLVESARKVLGYIGLDPASSDVANETVKAGLYYTIETDGLAQDWPRNVPIFMNPPYARGVIDAFINKYVDVVGNSDHPGAIAIVNNSTETRWFQRLLEVSDAVCFVRGRISFLRGGDLTPGQGLQGSVITYSGKNISGFLDEFEQYGPVLFGV